MALVLFQAVSMDVLYYYIDYLTFRMCEPIAKVRYPFAQVSLVQES